MRDAIVLAVILVFATAAPILAQDIDTPRPIAALDTVWIEEMTWMEVRDAIADGKTTVIVAAGSLEQNGPYVATAKHAYVLRATTEVIARQLGNALIAPMVRSIKAVAHPVFRHRLVTTFHADSEGVTTDAIVDMLLKKVSVELEKRGEQLARG